MRPPAPTRTATTADARRWKALGLVALADFMVVLDATIINIALPSVGTELHATTSSLAWVVGAYVLAFGALLMLGGRLADLFGRRRLFVAGLILFGAASLAGGLSGSIGVLIAFRVLQGIGAAMLAPAARAIVMTLFDDGPERSKAMGIWAAVAGSGTVVGLILGGVLTSALGWQWVLWINVPVSLGAAALAPRLLDESRSDTEDRSIDVAGTLLVTGGLAAALYALIQAGEAGWGSLQTVGLLSLSAVALGAFVRVEGRVAAPLMPLGIFRNAQVRGGNIAMAAVSAAMVGFFFVYVLDLQQLQGYGALQAGVSQLPLGVVLVVVAGLAGPLTERVGAKAVLIGGTAVFTAGVAWLTRLPADAAYLTDILAPSLLVGAGLGLSFVALMVASATGVREGESGIASGLLNTTQQIGGAVGLAVVTAVLDAQLGSGPHDATTLHHGFGQGLVVAAGLAVAALALAAVVLPGRERAPLVAQVGTA